MAMDRDADAVQACHDKFFAQFGDCVGRRRERVDLEIRPLREGDREAAVAAIQIEAISRPFRRSCGRFPAA
jgi:hypothetical protein